jgi:hypothetical protein
MEDSKKKPIMIGVIVVCLVVAGLITFARRGGGGGGGLDTIPSDKMTWVKCNNPSCNAEYEMSEREFYKLQQERLNPMARTAPALTCEKCGKDSLYKAEKCANPSCGAVFISGSVPNDFADRCPKCKQSATEEIRKRRLSGQE